MKRILVITLIVLGPMTGFCQQVDTLIKKLDSLSQKAPVNAKENVTNKEAYTKVTGLTPSTYFILLGSDLKQAFTKPFHMKRGEWGKVGLFALGVGALTMADEPVQRNALHLREHSKLVRDVSGQITKFGGIYEAYTLGALGAYGFLFRNKKIQTTTLLATQSYITGALLESTLKLVAGRQRPYITDSTKVEVEPRFYGPFYKTPRDPIGRKTNSSFPSGHTTVAFAAATVFAMEYKDRPWVPVLAYSAASMIGLSRILENRHWTTDVVVGATLGYLSGRLVVNNYHRYAKLRDPNEKKSSLRFNLQYNEGHVTPGLVYTFRQ